MIDGKYNSTHDISSDGIADLLIPEAVQKTAFPSPSTPTIEMPSTPYPTTDIRIPVAPTRSPSPTIEMVIHGNSSEVFVFGSSGGGGGSRYPNTMPSYSGPPTITRPPSSNLTFEEDGMTQTSSTIGSMLLATDPNVQATQAALNSSTTWSPGATTSTTFGFSSSAFTSSTMSVRFLYDDEDEEGFGDADTDGDVQDERLLEGDEWPESVIEMRSCSFEGNTGTATIMVASYSNDLSMSDQDPGVLGQTDDVFSSGANARQGSPPLAHSIHLMLEDTTFMVSVPVWLECSLFLLMSLYTYLIL